MNPNDRKQAIAQEWMINVHHPLHSISRLKYRATYTDVTLWWLVVQLDLLDKNSRNPQINF